VYKNKFNYGIFFAHIHINTILMKTTTLLFIFFFATASFAQTNYSTRCEIKKGTAYGYVDNFGSTFQIDGTVWFHFYDSTGRFIKSEDEQESESVTFKSSEEIEHTTAPLNANQCHFDIKEAIKEESNQDVTKGLTPNFSSESYSTSCELKNGVAYGYVHNRDDSFQINGTVWFHFYDCNGKFIESEDEQETEHVWLKSTEEIEHTTAPSRACKCTFDVKEAVEK
jgi:hypothetical protein